MQNTQPFFTNDLEGWSKIVGMLLIICSATVALLRSNFVTTFSKRTEVDGVGGRVKTLEDGYASNKTKIENLDQQMRDERMAREALARELAAVRAEYSSLRDLLMAGKIELMKQLQDIQRSVDKEQIDLRERVVRLETLNNLKVGQHA